MSNSGHRSRAGGGTTAPECRCVGEAGRSGRRTGTPSLQRGRWAPRGRRRFPHHARRRDALAGQPEPAANMAEAIGRRFQRFGGVDVPEAPRESLRAPPAFE
ncbi:hypothetical protein DEW08_29070 (plasmid) [Azospirillum thermophilum]|uniref:Uncharacterized protein n=1 Tax=Azospirillum thermophilum TaxID=2202148 RepID=A0A2S2CZV1_9PROT|nr:hypothetical protein DEW08_29070 [Azospirillum thermophilum]